MNIMNKNVKVVLDLCKYAIFDIKVKFVNDINWKLAQDIVILRPFAWLYQIIRYINIVFINNVALKEPVKISLLNKLLMADLSKVDEKRNCNIEMILKKYGG